MGWHVGRLGWGFTDNGLVPPYYLNYTNSGNGTLTLDTSGSSLHLSSFDLQCRIRVADWDASLTNRASILYASGPSGHTIDMGRTASDMYVHWVYPTLFSPAETTVYATWADLGSWADNTWQWYRVTIDMGNGVRFWTSSDGLAWSVAKTSAMPGSATGAIRTDSSQYLVGSGIMSSSWAGAGWNGDISNVTIASSVGGSPIADINLAAVTSVSDLTWANGGSYSDTWARNASYPTNPSIVAV